MIKVDIKKGMPDACSLIKKVHHSVKCQYRCNTKLWSMNMDTAITKESPYISYTIELYLFLLMYMKYEWYATI